MYHIGLKDEKISAIQTSVYYDYAQEFDFDKILQCIKK